jgi:exodeoxyribonuclease-3
MNPHNTLRLATWNCRRGKVAVKLPHLLNLNPDVIAIQECARPPILQKGVETWYGDNPNQGIFVAVNNGLRLKPVRPKETPAKFFLPLRIDGPVTFNLLTVWAKPSARTPRYVSTLFDGIAAYKRFIKSAPTIILGDFNSEGGLSVKDHHLKFVDLLRTEFGLVSAYHQHFKLEHGHETHSTYYHYVRQDNPWHIDYCFIPQTWCSRLKNVTVGAYTDWKLLSDHMPVIIEFEM